MENERTSDQTRTDRRDSSNANSNAAVYVDANGLIGRVWVYPPARTRPIQKTSLTRPTNNASLFCFWSPSDALADFLPDCC